MSVLSRLFGGKEASVVLEDPPAPEPAAAPVEHAARRVLAARADLAEAVAKLRAAQGEVDRCAAESQRADQMYAILKQGG